jgi:crotonobetainyl-CoA:carnitine CoA-transferase CaiB-like acyl-CoA transferase
VFQASDQAIVVAVGNDGQFARLAALLGHAEWASDPAFATNAARVASRNVLVPQIAAILAGRTAMDWLELLEASGIPAGPINGILQALRESNGRVSGPNGAAARLGLRRTTLQSRMKKLGIEHQYR